LTYIPPPTTAAADGGGVPTAATTHRPGQTMESEPADFTTMSDPDFLAERRRVREKVEQMPGQSVERARLVTLRDAMDEEFDRRARAAWSTAD
jgi:hypothetical protein